VKADDVELLEQEQLAALRDIVHLSSNQIAGVGELLFHTPPRQSDGAARSSGGDCNQRGYPQPLVREPGKRSQTLDQDIG
jgi:hypothetical protein